jgi:ribosomal protein L11 methyltransferase
MVILEPSLAGSALSIPFYFLLPISILAWFAGWRPALLAATAVFALTLAIMVTRGSHANTSPTVYLPRLITFAFAASIACALTAARQVVELFYRNPGWRATDHPIRIGSRLIVVPTPEGSFEGKDPDLEPAIIPIYIQPGMAFGTASHPTTRMCLELLEQVIRPGVTVLDLGCGTGILAIAAAKMGAEYVQAVDIAPRAIELARANLAHNHVSDRVTLLHGSFEAVKPRELPGSYGIPKDLAPAATRPTQQRFDLVLANLLAEVIKDLLHTGLPDILSQEGILIASGVRSSELASVQAAFLGAHLGIEQLVEDKGWCALVARREYPDGSQFQPLHGSA